MVPTTAVDALRAAHVSLQRWSQRGSNAQYGTFRIDMENYISLRAPVFVYFYVESLGLQCGQNSTLRMRLRC